MPAPRHSSPLRAGGLGREGRPAPPATTCADRAGHGRRRARPAAPPHPGRPMCASRRLRAVLPGGRGGERQPGAGPAGRSWVMLLLLLVLPPPRIGDGACNSRSGPSSSALRETRGEPRGEPAGGSLPGRSPAGVSPDSPRSAAFPEPARNLSSSSRPRTAGAEVISEFGRSNEGRRCSKRCRFVPSVL